MCRCNSAEQSRFCDVNIYDYGSQSTLEGVAPECFLSMQQWHFVTSNTAAHPKAMRWPPPPDSNVRCEVHRLETERYYIMLQTSGSQSARYRPLGGGGITEVGANR